MSIILFANNAASTLAAPISSGSLSANLAAGTGALFPNPGPGEYFCLTFVDAATGLINEIVHVTARTADTVTIARAQEGTVALNWLAGDAADNFWTAGSATALQTLALNAPVIVGATRNAKMAVAAASATSTFTADEIVIASSLGGAAYLLTTYSQAINLGTTGAGGMDTGTAPAPGYVALYAIYNPATGAQNIFAVNATSAAAPQVYAGGHMPAGYAASALIGVWPTNVSSLFKPGLQIDRKLLFPIINALSTSTGQASFTSISIAGSVPANARGVSGVIALSSTATSNMAMGVAADANGSGQQNGVAVGTNGTNISFGNFSLALGTPQAIFYVASSSAGTPTYTLSLSGYEI